jgi:hypothetical protein
VAASQPQPQAAPQAQAAAAGVAFAEAALAWQPQAQSAPGHWMQLQEGVVVVEAVFIEISWMVVRTRWIRAMNSVQARGLRLERNG